MLGVQSINSGAGGLAGSADGTTITNAAGVFSAKIGGHVSFNPIEYTAVTGTWAWGADAPEERGGKLYQSTPAQNNKIQFLVDVPAGTYVVGGIGIKSNNCGIMTVKLAGNTLGTVDCYNAGDLYNQRLEVAGVVVSTKGLQTLSLEMLTKNGASSNYQLLISTVYLYRTA